MKKIFAIFLLLPLALSAQVATFKAFDTNFFLWSVPGNYMRFNPLGAGATNWSMLNVTGRVAAGSFVGDGSGLTNLPSGGTNGLVYNFNSGQFITSGSGGTNVALNPTNWTTPIAAVGENGTNYTDAQISISTNNFNELMHKFKVAPTLNDLVITNFANRLNTATNALRIAYFGDSMTAPDTGGAIDGFITNLVQLHGRSGGLVANYPHYYYEFAGGSATIAPNTNWWSNHIFLTNGATINWRAGQVNGPTNGGVNNGANVWADSAAVYFLNQSGAGTFTISISTNGGAYGVVATIDANTTRAGVVTNFSLPLGYYQLKLTGTAGTNTIIDAGLWVENHRVVAPISISSSGYTYNDWAAVTTNVTWPIFSFWSPDVTLMEAKDTAAIFTNAFPQLERMFTNCVPDMDAVYMGTTPQQLEGDNITNTIPQNAAMRELAETYNRFYWDTYTLFRSYTNATALGFTSGDGTHFNSEGGIFKGRLLWAEVFRNVLILSSLNPIVSAGANVIVTPSTNTLTGQITYSVASSGGGLSTNDFDTNYFTWTGTNFVFNTNRFFAGDIPVYVEGLTNGFTIVTNANGTRTWTVFYKTNYSTSAGLETNSITGAHFRQTNSVVTAATNHAVAMNGSTYTVIDATNDVNLIFSGVGGQTVFLRRNGTNRLVTLTTNTPYFNSFTNYFTALGGLHSLNLTNAQMTISVYRVTDSDTNMTVNVSFSNPAEATITASATNALTNVITFNVDVDAATNWTFSTNISPTLVHITNYWGTNIVSIGSYLPLLNTVSWTPKWAETVGINAKPYLKSSSQFATEFLPGEVTRINIGDTSIPPNEFQSLTNLTTLTNLLYFTADNAGGLTETVLLPNSVTNLALPALTLTNWSTFPTGLVQVDFTAESSPLATVGTLTNSPNVAYLSFIGLSLTESEVDQILEDLVANGLSDPGYYVDLSGGANSAPSAGGLADKATLEAADWTVTVNP